jgi:hypothetical protein
MTAGLLVVGGTASAAVAVPAATLTPVNVPGTTAMNASPPADLAKYGYVEQEYYITGTANRYRFPTSLGNAEVIDIRR